MKYKFRRTKMGILWTCLIPFMLTLIMGFVFGTVFQQPVLDAIPFILSGLLVWDILVGSVIANSACFMSAEAYIRQYANPSVIYSLRASLVSMCSFLIASLSMVIWVLILNPSTLIIGALSFPLTFVLYLLISWPISNIAAHIHIRFRDYPLIMALVMQMVWFLSPVFFREEMFHANEFLRMLLVINPVTHILNIFRDPFLFGRFADARSYLYVLSIIIVLNSLSVLSTKKLEKDIIFHF